MLIPSHLNLPDPRPFPSLCDLISFNNVKVFDFLIVQGGGELVETMN